MPDPRWGALRDAVAGDPTRAARVAELEQQIETATTELDQWWQLVTHEQKLGQATSEAQRAVAETTDPAFAELLKESIAKQGAELAEISTAAVPLPAADAPAEPA